MLRYVVAMTLMLPTAPACADASKLVGTWKLKSGYLVNLDTKERRFIVGEKPSGYLVATPDRIIVVITPEDLRKPDTDADRVHNYRSMFAYSGKYTIDGEKFATKVDVYWNQTGVGRYKVRFYRFNGDDELHIVSAVTPIRNLNWEKGHSVVEWVREK